MRIEGFIDRDCSVSLAEPVTATIGSSGVFLPLIWADNGTSVEVQSIKYLEPVAKNATAFCDPIQFVFYHSQTQFAAVAYLTPGQEGHGCVDFDNLTVEAYTGVKMLAGLPDGFLGAGQ